MHNTKGIQKKIDFLLGLFDAWNSMSLVKNEKIWNGKATEKNNNTQINK